MDAGTKKNREKILAVTTAAVIVGVFIFGIIVEPQIKKRKRHIEQLHQTQLQLTKMQGDLLIKGRVDKIYAQVEPLIAGGGTDQQEISLFTRELGDLYSKLAVKIRSVKILPCANEPFYRRLSIKIEMSGHIKDVLRFIQAVEGHSNPIRIEQLDLKAMETKNNVQLSLLVSKVVAEAKT